MIKTTIKAKEIQGIS